MTEFEIINDLANKVFLCEIVTDGWANWKFDDNGKPIYKTATPLYLNKNKFDYIKSVSYRGLYWYFNKKGQLIRDDIGCFNKDGLNRAFKKLIEEYESIKDDIDENGFKNNL